MPTSSPVVNGIDSRPASSSTRSRIVGVLVGGAEVGLALGLEQPPRGGLEHHPHRGGDRLEPVELLPRHHAGVEVGQQPGLLEHPDRHRADVGERGVVALLVEPLPRLRPPVLGPVAQGEQRLEAAELGPLAGDLEDLVGGEEHPVPGPLQLTGRLHERAVVAAVAAQLGDGDEHLGRVGDHPRSASRLQPGVTHPGGGRTQAVEVVARGREQDGRLADVERRSALGARQGAPHLLGSGEVGSHRGQANRGRTGSIPPSAHGCERCVTR